MRPNAAPVLEVVGKQKKQTDMSKFWVEGGEPAAYTLWTNSGLMSEQLNKHQWLAVKNAMSYKFTLIQGPPGEL